MLAGGIAAPTHEVYSVGAFGYSLSAALPCRPMGAVTEVNCAGDVMLALVEVIDADSLLHNLALTARRGISHCFKAFLTSLSSP